MGHVGLALQQLATPGPALHAILLFHRLVLNIVVITLPVSIVVGVPCCSSCLLCCCRPVVNVFLQMLFVPDVSAMARVSAVAAFPTAVEVCVFNVHGGP